MTKSRAATLLFAVAIGMIAAGSTAADDVSELGTLPPRLGVVSFYSPRLMFLKYQPLIDYLTRHTGRTWELALAGSYQEAVDRLCSGDVALAYLGPLTYIRAHHQCGTIPVVALRTGGKPIYNTHIMVRADAPYVRIEDLAGQRFAFGARLSASSHLVPRAMLIDGGVPLEEVEFTFLGHHERAARAVLLGEADACGVRDVVGDRFLGRGLRIIATSPSIANMPLVVLPQAPEELTKSVFRALVEVPAWDVEAAREIAALDEELSGGFAPCADSDYDGIRSLARRVFGPRFLELPASELGGG
uniref:Phosphate/phosphite/phosphonate ABC transporter substrate-binding protein n=1 Tax=uncultured sulfate-reducing bacterium TaxID=153939 RepID=Q3IBQ2_9BACT|nr:conserved hypothetical protein [uncultured sulfate-reducing bacterium]